MTIETATLAGGCFWCTEAVFNDVIGVQGVESPLLGGGELVVAEESDHPLRLGLGEVEAGTGVLRGEEAGAGVGADAAAGAEDDEAGEVVVFGAQAVGDPGAYGGAGGADVAGVEEVLGGAVGGVEGVHGADDAEVISASENEISFGVFGWGRADTQAEEHCRRFDKEAIYQTTLKVNEYNDSRIVYYNCVRRGS